MNDTKEGNCFHEIEASDNMVLLYNDGDDFYVTEFNSQSEVEEFITKLLAEAEKAFGG